MAAIDYNGLTLNPNSQLLLKQVPYYHKFIVVKTYSFNELSWYKGLFLR